MAAFEAVFDAGNPEFAVIRTKKNITPPLPATVRIFSVDIVKPGIQITFDQ